jgi:hypothetical protein
MASANGPENDSAQGEKNRKRKKKKSQWWSKNFSLLNLEPRSGVVHFGGKTFLYRIKDLTVQSSTLPEEAAMTKNNY